MSQASRRLPSSTGCPSGTFMQLWLDHLQVGRIVQEWWGGRSSCFYTICWSVAPSTQDKCLQTTLHIRASMFDQVRSSQAPTLHVLSSSLFQMDSHPQSDRAPTRGGEAEDEDLDDEFDSESSLPLAIGSLTAAVAPP